MKRRTFLATTLGLCALPLSAHTAGASGRVVVVGGGWGGLAAARHLRELAPQIDVVLIDRQPEFWSQPLSNRWLVGLARSEWLKHDYRQAAQRFGYRFVAAEVRGIDRSAREVATAAGSFGYDWLVLAPGIREDFSAWFGVDRDSAAHTRQHFPSAFPAGRDHLALKAKLEAFRGGDLVMTIPPMPYRCPPAPYERAGLIAWWLKTRNIKGRLIVLDCAKALLETSDHERAFTLRDALRPLASKIPQNVRKDLLSHVTGRLLAGERGWEAALEIVRDTDPDAVAEALRQVAQKLVRARRVAAALAG